ncbi:universal stress protein [Mycolicibacterium sp. P9-64]|uniref:universal stress protein n=1 Tax=Mycolicibacterium sp. P9-64 TaxID=2024612 RepID=UPI0015653C04|nr:universal stress protein [Mycolicibacterium sp. P9-64]
MSTYVVLVNERPESRAALDWTLKQAAPLSNTESEDSLHVVLGPGTDIPGGPRYVSPALSDEVAKQLDASGVLHDLYSEAADPVHRVITLAEDVRADLVVIGMQKRSATLKLFIGSHARDILVDAPCPVVAVKE